MAEFIPQFASAKGSVMEFITNASKLPVAETAACPMPALGIIRFRQVGTSSSQSPKPITGHSGGCFTSKTKPRQMGEPRVTCPDRHVANYVISALNPLHIVRRHRGR